MTSYGAREASSDNRLSIPAARGSRPWMSWPYRFTLGEAPASLRIAVGNVFNKFGWRTNQAAVFTTNAPRRVMATLAADF